MKTILRILVGLVFLVVGTALVFALIGGTVWIFNHAPDFVRTGAKWVLIGLCVAVFIHVAYFAGEEFIK